MLAPHHFPVGAGNGQKIQILEFFIKHLSVERRLMKRGALHEYALMKNGMDYDRAHAKSRRLEHRCRRHPDELHQALAKEGWE